MYYNLFTLFLTDLWALHASIIQRTHKTLMSENNYMFEPVKDAVSKVGCRMTQRSWVASQKQKKLQPNGYKRFVTEKIYPKYRRVL